jgi:hypothetical protein
MRTPPIPKRTVAQRVICDPLEDQAEHGGRRERQEVGRQHRDTEQVHQRHADEGRHHHHLALSEVDHANRLVDEHEAERDQCVNGAEGKPRYK